MEVKSVRDFVLLLIFEAREEIKRPKMIPDYDLIIARIFQKLLREGISVDERTFPET